MALSEDRSEPERAGPPPGGARAKRKPQVSTDQRSRLLGAVVEVVAQDGYADAKIGQIASRAGVSRATFYEQFASKEECFVAALRTASDALLAEAGAAIAGAEEVTAGTEGALAMAAGALAGLAEREPAAFTSLLHESMLAGAAAVRERERLMEGLQAQVDAAHEGLAADALIPDVPVALILGGVTRVLGFHMRRGETGHAASLRDLLTWTDCYATEKRARRWTELVPDPRLFVPEAPDPPPALAPQPLPRGRHRLEGAVVDRVQRERLLEATAKVVRQKGYANMTVGNVVSAARVGREVFYAHFHDKREAFMATYRQGFEHSLVAAAEAFFTSQGEWPERVWESGRAFTLFFLSVPDLAYLGFVESYALGPEEAPRADDTLLGFTVFLEDGYRYRPEAADLPRVASEAIAGAVVETAVAYVRHDRVAELPGLLPVISYLVLAPFTGTAAANEFIERKLDEAAQS